MDKINELIKDYYARYLASKTYYLYKLQTVPEYPKFALIGFFLGAGASLVTMGTLSFLGVL